MLNYLIFTVFFNFIIRNACKMQKNKILVNQFCPIFEFGAGGRCNEVFFMLPRTGFSKFVWLFFNKVFNFNP